MNTLLKVLCTILNNRLITYSSNNHLINKEQIGFQKHSRTSDHILTLKALVNKYVSDKNGKKLYTCFVDFQKAFDSIWHDALFRKLENKGINGNFLELIKNIYSHTKCAVKINTKTTKYFKYKRGVQQGNPLSPLLFNLFINDIFESIKNESPLTLDNVNFINNLMYADDLIILSTTPEGLQKSLDALEEYCNKWKLNINIKKTKCMIFSKGCNIKNTNFILNKNIIENVKEFKYLGITINRKNCTFSPTLNDLSGKANRALYAILSKLPIKMAPVKSLLKLFDSCITPILLYGSEVWSPYLNNDESNWDSTEIEKVHTQFLKRILGVNRSTTNALVRSELGRHSLQDPILSRNINYIKYIEQKGEQTLVKQAANYEYLYAEKRHTLYRLFNNLEANLLTTHNNNIGNIKTMSRPKLRNLINEISNSQWQAQISSLSKADTYKQFKNRVKFENYLSNIKNRKHRVAYTKYRLSDHCLMIEVGRHNRPITPRDQRFCPFCPSMLEDEKHFLLQCSAYKNRDELLNFIIAEVPNFANLDIQSQFIFLMSQENTHLTTKLVYTIYEWFTMRIEHRDKLKTQINPSI